MNSNKLVRYEFLLHVNEPASNVSVYAAIL